MKRMVLRISAFILFCLTCVAVNAGTLSFTTGDLYQFVEESQTSGDRLSQLIGNELQQRLGESGLSLNENSLVFETKLPKERLRGGCSMNVSLRRAHLSVTLSPESEFQLILDALSKPIIASVDLIGHVEADGRVRVRFGSKVLGKCIRYATDNINIEVDADVVMNVALVLNLNPTKVIRPNGDLEINIDPQIDLSGEVVSVTNQDVDLHDVDFTKVISFLSGGVLGLLIENRLIDYIEESAEDELSTTAANNAFQIALAEKEEELEAQIADIPTSFVVEKAELDLLTHLFRFINKYPTAFPVSFEYLLDHEDDILYYLYIGDDEALLELLGTSLACNVASSLSSDMQTVSVPSGTNFSATSFADYCAELVDETRKLGDADAWDGDNELTELPWTLMPTSQLDIGALSIDDNYQPYMKRVKYKTIPVISGTRQECWYEGEIGDYLCFPVPVPRGNGQCKLEMRVYKKDIAATNSKPLLAIHGGSWKYRGAAFIGMESQISHYTEQGFTVFAPFYRLVGNSDGNHECNSASGEDVLDDVASALTWVEQNMSQYGAIGQVHLMGQSAGAHLAANLSVNHYDRIAKTLLFYPPTDFQDYIQQVQTGVESDPAGIDAIEGFLSTLIGDDQTIMDVDINDPLIVDNSFPQIVQNAPSLYPPMFMIHGRSDILVPSRQSVRLCNALAGNANSGPALNEGGEPTEGTFRQVYRCDDRGSWLDMIAEADHALDVCIPYVRCQAGSEDSVEQVQASMNDSLRWLNGDISRAEGAFPNFGWFVPIVNLLLH